MPRPLKIRLCPIVKIVSKRFLFQKKIGIFEHLPFFYRMVSYNRQQDK